MTTVTVRVDEITIETDREVYNYIGGNYGGNVDGIRDYRESTRHVPGVEVQCTRCQHTVQVFGRGEASVRRGCAMLREECPLGRRNFYTPRAGA
jgi:hypothetical protein